MKMRGILILAAVLSMTACASHGDDANRTVTYRYSGDLYGLRFEEVSEEASAYCVEEFDARAQLQQADDSGDENLAVFECL
jgi:hypothetical protein